MPTKRRSVIEREAARIEAVADFIRERAPTPPQVGIVLGSGIATLAEHVKHAVRVPYAECRELPGVTVEGHRGTLVLGWLSDVPCAVMQGRFHLYEGHDAATVALPARGLLRAGVSTLIVTNSAGGVNRTFRPGDLMLIDDHINLQWSNPLIGPVVPGEARFPDMSAPYDPALLRRAEAVALDQHIRVVRGVYCALPGPSYETPAEIRMLERMGADAVGMSTVPEVLVARALGVPVLGISVITNVASGLVQGPVTHEDVIAVARDAATTLARLVAGVVAGMRDA
jgi:purine-nucleoside phosphorylase